MTDGGMKQHKPYMIAGMFPGSTITGTVCGRESSKSDDGTNSANNDSGVTCKLCLRIMANPKDWRHRKYITGAHLL